MAQQYFTTTYPVTVGGVTSSGPVSGTTGTFSGNVSSPTVSGGSAITDPGDAGAIPVTGSGVCAITTAGAETRTLAIPTFVGQRVVLAFDVDGGNCVVTVAETVNVTGNNTLTAANAGETIELVSGQMAGALIWRVSSNDGWVLSTV